MPKLPHQLPVDLVREDPESLPRLLLTAFDFRLPKFDRVTACSGELTQDAPVEYAADQVVLGYAKPADKKPAHAVIFESQRRRDNRKRFSWPLYVAAARARYRCKTTLVVFCPNEWTAVWAAKPIDMGHPGWNFRPLALGPGRMPTITDPVRLSDTLPSAYSPRSITPPIPNAVRTCSERRSKGCVPWRRIGQGST